MEFTGSDLKHYPHFDAPIPISEIQALVTSPERVAKHGFFPLLRYDDEWTPYQSKDASNWKKKSRPIRYGARGDTYIFKQYREVLAKAYEVELHNSGISHCPLAYRHIPKESGNGGKCNIDFAKDAFDRIDSLGDCVSIALDIASYFENLDHSHIKRMWCNLLDVERLPPDHYAVFKNITRYRFIDREATYRRLGFADSRGLIKPYKDIPVQLCSPSDFRSKICGINSEYTSLIQKNTDPFGIPQGVPISDLIANFYLLDFDREMHHYAVEQDGCYMRYSDDILLLLVGGRERSAPAVSFASDQIKKYGKELNIKNSKTCVIEFQRQADRLTYQHIKQNSDERRKNGFEYLGFRYDGRNVYVRDSTVSSFYRKVSAAAKVEGWKHAMCSESKDLKELTDTFNYSSFSQQFSRVKGYRPNGEYTSRTFYSYLKRAAETFGSKGNRILNQARNFNEFMHRRIENAIAQTIHRKST